MLHVRHDSINMKTLHVDKILPNTENKFQYINGRLSICTTLMSICTLLLTICTMYLSICIYVKYICTTSMSVCTIPCEHEQRKKSLKLHFFQFSEPSSTSQEERVTCSNMEPPVEKSFQNGMKFAISR